MEDKLAKGIRTKRSSKPNPETSAKSLKKWIEKMEEDRAKRALESHDITPQEGVRTPRASKPNPETSAKALRQELATAKITSSFTVLAPFSSLERLPTVASP
jgi:hypothetical protein